MDGFAADARCGHHGSAVTRVTRRKAESRLRPVWSAGDAIRMGFGYHTGENPPVQQNLVGFVHDAEPFVRIGRRYKT
ncbi:hypothetical protein D8S78_01580 [Natrialba swarupiae]|nr:hypothetical protein [Natrialba swarupiae]